MPDDDQPRGYPIYTWSQDSRGIMMVVRGDTAEQLLANVEALKKVFGLDTSVKPVIHTEITPPTSTRSYSPPSEAQPAEVSTRYVCNICGGTAYLNSGVSAKGKPYKIMKCKDYPDITAKGGHSRFLD